MMMKQAIFRFEAQLNDFLPSQKRWESFTHYFKERPSIKDTIESLGVPHPEVNIIIVNEESVDFSYILQDGDRVTVYPISTSSEVTPILNLQPPIPEIPRFVLDVHLGKLASLLRMLGFDTLYRNDYEDPELAEISATENRIVLTRDKGVLMRSIVTYGYYIRETNPEKQIVELLRRYQLFDAVEPFHRCIRCNGSLEPVDKESIADQLPPKTQEEIDEFHRCCGCGQIYWQGAHYDRMQEFVAKVLSFGMNDE